MEIFKAEVEPISTTYPTLEENQATESLKQYLQQLQLYETKEEVQHREELLEALQTIVRKSIQQILEAKNLYFNQKDKELGSLYTFGSFRMKINEPSADIDTMFVGPAAVTREEFFEITSSLLKENPEASGICVISDAYVPIITMKFGGIEFDLSYAPIARCPHRIPLDFDILDDENLRGVDDKTARSLNGRRVTDTILKLTQNNHANFLLTLKAFRYWARKRCLYKNVMGYLGGVNCALFCAYATMLFPNASAAVILHKCFKIFAEWKWPKPVVLTDVMLKPELGQDENVWNPDKNEKCRNDLFPVLTPCYPSQNSCYTVMKSTRSVMVSEFERARDITEKILAGKAKWSELFEDLPFFTQYKYYIQVEVRGTSEEHFTEWYGYVESRLRHFIPLIENGNPVTTHLLPKSFEVPNVPFCKHFFISFTVNGEVKDKVLNLSAATRQFKQKLDEAYMSEIECDVEITCLKNVAKVNELPDYLFPEGKQLKKHRRKVKRTLEGGDENDAKKQKTEYYVF